MLAGRPAVFAISAARSFSNNFHLYVDRSASTAATDIVAPLHLSLVYKLLARLTLAADLRQSLNPLIAQWGRPPITCRTLETAKSSLIGSVYQCTHSNST
ncbi:MAG: hypothetical protein WA268_09065 [Xanthobacteraceae bacterium]